MKAVSLWQPWASLVRSDIKTIETRHWATSYRGPLAIHAAKRKPDVGDYAGGRVNRYETGYEMEFYEPGDPGQFRLIGLPLGAVVATCNLVDCLPIVGWNDGPVVPRMAGLKVVAVCDDDRDGTDENGNPFARVWTYGEFDRGLGVWSSGYGESVTYGDYTPGRFAWILEGIQRLPQPIPATGHQGLWEWSP